MSKNLRAGDLATPRPPPTHDELVEWHGRAEALVEEAFQGLEHLDVDRNTGFKYWNGTDKAAFLRGDRN